MKLIYYFLTTVWLCLLACSDSPTGPDEKPLNPNEYLWTTDTLTGISPTDLWGSSSEDVYVTGLQKVMHFNGTWWLPVGLRAEGAVSAEAVFGFARDDVWVVGREISTNPNPPPRILTQSLIFHFDGANWRRYQTPNAGLLHDVWASGPNDVWATGQEGKLLHYDGKEWSLDSVRVDALTIDKLDLTSVFGLGTAEVYFLGRVIKEDGTVFRYFLCHKDKKWQLIDSFTEWSLQPDKWGTADLWASSDGTLFSIGYGVFAWKGSSWNWTLQRPFQWFYGIAGMNANNLIAVGRHGQAFHFDGHDWLQIEALAHEDVDYTKVWADDDGTVVIVGNNTSEALVRWGRPTNSPVVTSATTRKGGD